MDIPMFRAKYLKKIHGILILEVYGCPMTSNFANCGILTIKNDTVLYEDLKLNYDVQEVIRDIETKKYPAYKGMIDIFYGKRHSNIIT